MVKGCFFPNVSLFIMDFCLHHRTLMDQSQSEQLFPFADLALNYWIYHWTINTQMIKDIIGTRVKCDANKSQTILKITTILLFG